MRDDEYFELLKRELRPALGCTEPIAVAYCASRARALLGRMPDRIHVACSGNILKNAKGVVVPTTGDMRGVDVSAVLGAVAGRPELEMEVLRDVTPKDISAVSELLSQGICRVSTIPDGPNLQISVEMQAGDETSLVVIRDTHTHIVLEQKNGVTLYEDTQDQEQAVQGTFNSMTVDDIVHFAERAECEKLKSVLNAQLEDNMVIAQEGLRGNYGMQVGRTVLEHERDSLRDRAIAMAAAGSDARMSGCELPVVINSGSGNQGMTVSVPVIVYGRGKGYGEDRILRALAISNLVALYQKSYIGELSAYCGVISASCGAIAGIAYLDGDEVEVISDTIINTIAVVSGIVCDGAKPSCAAKIAIALKMGFLALDMARSQRVFRNGEGLVKRTVDTTIAAYGKMGAEGMRETDHTILEIMSEES